MTSKHFPPLGKPIAPDHEVSCFFFGAKQRGAIRIETFARKMPTQATLSKIACELLRASGQHPYGVEVLLLEESKHIKRWSEPFDNYVVTMSGKPTDINFRLFVRMPMTARPERYSAITHAMYDKKVSNPADQEVK